MIFSRHCMANNIETTLKRLQAICWTSLCLHDMVMFSHIYIYIYICAHIIWNDTGSSCDGIVQIFIEATLLSVPENINLIHCYAVIKYPWCVNNMFLLSVFYFNCIKLCICWSSTRNAFSATFENWNYRTFRCTPLFFVSLYRCIAACKALLYPNNSSWKSVC